MDLSFFDGELVNVQRRTYTGTDNPDTGEPNYIVETIQIECLYYFRDSTGRITPFENGFDSKLNLIMPFGTEIKQSDIFELRGSYWETDGIPQVLSNFPKYSRFIKPPTIVTLKQHLGNAYE